jgi:hypothetical protein
MQKVSGASVSTVKKDASGVETAEVKFDVSPGDIPVALKALGVHKAKGDQGSVLFFDTPGRDLAKRGILLREREDGPKGDLTVKLREDNPKLLKTLQRVFGGQDGFKEEDDVSGSSSQDSASLKDRLKAHHHGKKLKHLFTKEQRKMLKRAGLDDVPWKKLKKLGPVNTTEWTAKVRGMPALDVNRWDLPNGPILEVSFRVPIAEKAKALKSLSAFMKAQGVAQASGGLKTGQLYDAFEPAS